LVGRAVAPHAGARIETRLERQHSDRFLSPPTRGRGLKLAEHRLAPRHAEVAPHAGARIETPAAKPAGRSGWVAPHAGARIETSRRTARSSQSRCRPPRGGAD